MDVTVLGSCTVIQYPQDIERFFNDENLVDVRHGCRMEMDVLPLYFIAELHKDDELMRRLETGLLKNLQDSGGDLWKCGMWGHNEIHLRFTSVALRYMILNKQAFSEALVEACMQNHMAHHDNAFGGIWFYHDSIETFKQNYYRTWNGKSCGNASPNNMLIINTHLDTLITLLVAQKCDIAFTDRDQVIDKALRALEQYFKETICVPWIGSQVDSFFRMLLIKNTGKSNLISRILIQLVDRVYYRKIRFFFKKRFNVRRFSNGFLERDLRLNGPSLDYHIVNLWDMSRLLLWLNYNKIVLKSVSEELFSSALDGLKYCYESTSYRCFLKKLSIKKGVSNELLEAVAIQFALGRRDDWLAKLYLDWRAFAPPSIGILGSDRTISGVNLSEQLVKPTGLPKSIDWIPFETGLVIVVNHGETLCSVNTKNMALDWANDNSTKLEDLELRISAQSVAVVKLIQT